MTRFPPVSIIVAVKNGEKTIEKCLNSLLASDYPNFDVWVVDDGSVDATPALLEKYPSFHFLKTMSEGPAKARNTAMPLCNGELLAFTDADCIVARNWLSELVLALEENPEAVSCGGRQELPADATSFEKEVFSFMQIAGLITDYVRPPGANQTRKVRHNPSCNVLYRRTVLEEMNGFCEDLWPGEDVDLDYRLEKCGYTVIWNPRSVVYHYKPENWKKFAAMMFRYGCAQGELVMRHGPFRMIHWVALTLPPLLLSLLLTLATQRRNWAKEAKAKVKVTAIGGFLGLIHFRKPFVLLLCAMLCWSGGFVRGLLRSHKTKI